MPHDRQAMTAASRLLERFRHARAATQALAARLGAEDMQAQSMPDASPVKWHLAHTAWFFETFLLSPRLPGYRVFDEAFGYLFNSYYEAVGARHPRAERGLITRPTAARVLEWRAHVDEAMERLIPRLDEAGAALVELGVAHEEQHQELILMDALHLFSRSPLKPAFFEGDPPRASSTAPMEFKGHPGGLAQVGHGGECFAFDNEGPRHTVYLQPFAIADRLVTNGEWIDFIEDGGYRAAALWLADGWAMAQVEGWQAPLYWRQEGGQWLALTLHGDRPVDPHALVSHVSYYEADAYAAWAGKRLATEAEWEQAPLMGRLWQWTRSAYLAHPGFRPGPGAVGEYNGKFMVSQMVLKGGSHASPAGHARATYRNFFYPQQRWMFSGVRLADDA
ncbi:MAG TPA: ergothioneine biosynthesis protein EgtB [Caulobacteraceae bacterium]